ncbi:MAG: AAA family ATPase [Lachnospiraceae bacterium]
MNTVKKATEVIIEEVKKVITGKEDVIRKTFAAIIAGGHILIEDVPGVGKTTLALAFSKAMELDHHRVQFTPDVMPSDILGFSMYQKETGTFTYQPGTIMCNLFLADEINRTSPKTQSALLEVMEEGAVTVDGISHLVPQPFIVIATQNPKGSAGTQLLPESQLDRFMICTSMGYPDLESEIAIAQGKSTKNAANEVESILTSQGLLELQKEVEAVFIHESVCRYIATLSAATRENSYIELGISPRGTIACTRMAKAWAYLHDRDYVLPKDVTDIFLDIAKHRIVLNTKARVTHVTEQAVLTEILSTVKQPAAHQEKKYRE